MAFLNYQIQSCLANAPGDCSDVPGEVRSIIACDFNVVHELSTLVSFDNWVRELTHGTWKTRYRSAETLRKSLVGKGSAGKN